MRLIMAGPSLVAVALLLALPAGAAASSQKALAILAEIKAASGGDAWDKVTGWHETGVHGTTAYETWLDYQHYGSLFKQTRDDHIRLRGFNGTIAWDRGPDGRVVVSTEKSRLAEARTTAYASINGFLFPDRFPARFDYLRAASEGDRQYDVLRITPESANAFELWVDRATHLVAKLIDRTGERPVVATITGYEEVDGLKLGSGFTVSDGIPAHAETARIGRYEVTSLARSVFDPPVDN